MVLAACGGGGAGGASTSPGGGVSTSPGSGASADGFPVTIQNCGRTLTFDKPPSRAVLPYHPIAEIFVGLGLADRAVGRAGWSGGLKDPPILPEQAADFARVPVVSDNYFPPPKEQMLSLRPDFLLAYADFDYGGKHPGAEGLATLDELEAAGVQTYTVVCPDESGEYMNENLEAVYRSLGDLGKIFGVSDRAQRRVAEMKAQIADVSQKVSGEPVVKVIAYYGGEGPLLDGTKEAQFLVTTFPNMQASKDRRVVVTDFTYTSPGWRNAQTAEDIARQLHPDVFK
ncbi:MAG: ABC transporter substrate-binding protein [Pseudonocardiaceae bacterium]